MVVCLARLTSDTVSTVWFCGMMMFLSLHLPIKNHQNIMKDKARLVVIGAGIVGCSAVYHLTQMGWKDIVVIDKGALYETGAVSYTHLRGPRDS